MNRALQWLRARMGVRVVSALAAAAAVAVVLVVAGVSLVLLLNQSLNRSLQDAAEQQATLLGQRIAANFTGTDDAKQNALDATGKRTDIVQVLTDYGDDSDAPDSRVGSNGPQTDVQIIGSSDTLSEAPRMVGWLLAPGETKIVPSTEIRLGDGTVEEVTVVGKGFRATGRPITVLAAQELKPVHQAVDTVSLMVSIGIPILVLVAGFFTYLFAGRALRPVEAMRRRVAGLTDRDLARRVPEPPARDEVGRLARTMNQMLARLEDSQATQRRFVADASHELRSPLATVSTGLELLSSGIPQDAPDQATVQTLRGETARLTNLVEGLLFLARADERGVVPRREEVDLDEIAEGERSRPSEDERVTVSVSTEPVRVVGDRGQLVRVVRNLVDNARRHAATAVAVSVRVEDDLAVIDVDDDGPGVPESDRDRVFERFVRLDEARARGDGGSGLGLAIVSELVAAHGGAVRADRAPELGGARFRVTLPPAGSPVPAEQAPSPAKPPTDGPDGARGADGVPGAAATGSAPPEPGTAGPARPRAEAAEPSMFEDHRPPGPPAGPAPTGEHRPAGEPPTGPLPIRPTTVGSPADENATRPLPLVRPDRGDGTASAPAPRRGGVAVAVPNGRTNRTRTSAPGPGTAGTGHGGEPAGRRDRRSGP